ncbi:MAG: RidA family protein [Cellvibrionaceae bacterium]
MKLHIFLLAAAGCLFSQLSLSAERSSVEFLSSEVLTGKASSLPFSEAVRVDNTYYLSGQIGIAPGTKSLVKGGIKEETRQTLLNIQSTLEANNLSMKNVVKCTVMLADIAEWPSFNEVYVSFFSKPFPARSAFAGSGLAFGARVEVECIAVDF